MNEITDNFAWTRQLECPPTLCNDPVKKILCKGVLELLWEDISNCVYPTTEACKIKKNILLYKLRHGLKDSTIARIKDLDQSRCKNNKLKDQIAALEKEYDEQDHTVRRKMQQLKDINSKYSMMRTRKDFLKLKHNETKKQLKDCTDMRRVCQHLMPNTFKEIDEQRLRESLDVVAGLRSGNRKQVREKISNSLGSVDIYTLWTRLYQVLSQDLDTLMKLETKNDLSSSTLVGENIDIGIARMCGQYICMISKCALSNAKVSKYEERLVEFIQLIESLSHEDVTTWLALTLEVRKLETEQAYLQNEVQKLKKNCEDNSLLNLDIAQLTADIEAIDAQIDGYVKNIQQSITVLNCAASLTLEAKEKLHFQLQKIVAVQAEDYDAQCVSSALDIELDMFYNVLDLNALRKVMLKGDVGAYRHAVCCLDKASVAAINPQCSRIKPHFPMVQTPLYSLIECYRNAVANIIYTKLHCSTSTEKVEHADELTPSREKCNYNSLELLFLLTLFEMR
ncbi:uncharacterized protein LOC113562808 [Ooceraea biroi]|uniref:uncharacterized protein LOC113562808 n=1 Tax=Ooceraea biroi TaxID=2015173 RepID=UPI000F095E9F|nr:uncharacterized protein LOC113562808 [Ooceraea biroi]